MITISKHAQGTQEWLDDRKLHMTGSNASAIGNNGAGLETYCKRIVMENYCKNLEHYTNADMERGNELEPVAREVYSLDQGEIVDEVGFLKNDKYPMAGVSLDGTLDDRNIEIKCMNNQNHFNFILDGKIKSDWVWQMQMGMLISEKKKCDFIAYNPNFDKDLVIITISYDEIMANKLIQGLESGAEIIQKLVQEYKTK